MEPNYKIAILGFGSLPNQIHSDVYNQTLEVVKPAGQPAPSGYNLKPDSPFVPAAGLKLPLRLGRISAQDSVNRRITTVLHKNASEQQVFYAQSRFNSLREAIVNLQKREGCPTDRHIGYVDLLRNVSKSRIASLADKVKTWAIQNGFNAVLWSDLPEKGVEFAERSTGREILPLLVNDPVLLENTQKYIRNLAAAPDRLQQKILSMTQTAAAQFTKWPADPKTLSMTQEEVDILKNFLEQNYQALKNSNKTFKHDVGFELYGRNWKLPRTIAFLNDGTPIVHLKKLQPIGSGGQRTVKCAYNPLTGEIVAKKRILCRSELQLLQNFQKNRPKGIVSPIGIRKVVDSEGVKYQSYEKRYDTDLHTYLKNNSLSFDQKVNMIKTLLNALKYVHQLDYSFYPENSSRDIGEDDLDLNEFEKFTVKARHGDIKDENILIKKTQNGIETALSDFGCSEPQEPGCPDYMSPEDAKSCLDPYQIAINAFHGPADVWTLGLLIAKILKEEHPAGEVLPLKCMENIVQAWKRNPVREGRFHSMMIRQTEVDAEIEGIKNRCSTDRQGMMKRHLWSLVNKMLQTDQSKRISLSDACAETALLENRYSFSTALSANTVEAYRASLTADFAERARPDNQTRTPRSQWFNRNRWEGRDGDWGPFATQYPKPQVPVNAESRQWKRDRVIEAALYWVRKGVPYSSLTAYKTGQSLPSDVTPRFMLRGHFPARSCGLDCSNFASWVYNFGLGIQFSSAVNDLAPVRKDDNGRILRSSDGRPLLNENKVLSEPGAGRIIHLDEPLMKGDLLLYSGSPKHVAIYMDENHVIESTSSGQGIARVADLRNPEYAYLRPKASNSRYLFARRPID